NSNDMPSTDGGPGCLPILDARRVAKRPKDLGSVPQELVMHREQRLRCQSGARGLMEGFKSRHKVERCPTQSRRNWLKTIKWHCSASCVSPYSAIHILPRI